MRAATRWWAVCAALGVCVAFAALRVDHDPEAPIGPGSRMQLAPPAGSAPRPEAAQRATTPDVLDAYAAMRDDANPKPRLQLIDDWARRARPDAARELMARAMVDPDESVRERAQVLFDRSMSDR